MVKLAKVIRDNLDALARVYDEQLLAIDEYKNMGERERFVAAQGALRMMAAGLEIEDPDVFYRFAQSEASERLAQGLSLASVEQALTSLIYVLEPLFDTLETANFVWRNMLQVHQALQGMEEPFDKVKRTPATDDLQAPPAPAPVAPASVPVASAPGPLDQALARQEQEQRRILDAVPAMIWYKDRENRILRLNKAAAATMGLPVEKIEGRSVYDLNPDTAEEYHRDDQEVIESGQPKLGIVEPLVTADGRTQWLQTDKIPYLDDDGEIIGVIVFAQNITERRDLEQQVQESLERRGRQVETSTQVAQEIALAPALDDLYERVVTLVKERFGYYHAQLFLLRAGEDRLVTIAGYGEVGEQFVQEGHFIPLGSGVVGRAGASGLPVLSPDTSQDPEWLYHPLLPETKGELAVPIQVRGQVLGVLDVQSDRAGELTQDDQLLFEGLCGQIAVAIESTRLREEMEASLRELERLYQAASREGWEGFELESETSGYYFDRTDVVAMDAAESDSRLGMGMPLSVRGETFGELGVQSEDPLSADELALVESVAEQVAQALESARLFEQTQSALAETEDLYRASADINAAGSLDQVLDALCAHSLLEAADAGASIQLFDQPLDDENLAGAGALGPEWILTGARRGAGGDAAAQSLPAADLVDLLRADAPSLIHNVDTDPRLGEKARAHYAEEAGARSALSVPLVVGGQWLGYVEGLYGAPTDFPEPEVRRLMALAAQAAVAVQSLQQLLDIERLFDEEQQARALLSMRVGALDTLNDLGRKIDETPLVAEFLQWVAERIPPAMQYPDFCRAAIEFNGDRYGAEEAIGLPCQIVAGMVIGGREVGKVHIAYTQQLEFADEESALLGDIARRVGGYIENRRLLQETQLAARELGEERTLLRTLIDAVPDLVYTKDTESRFVLNNKAHLVQLGVTSQDEVAGKTDLDIFPGEFAERYYADEQELFRTGEPLLGREEPALDRSTGQERWFLTAKVPLRDSAGTVVGLVGVGRDITERKEAEQILERRRVQLECLSDIGERIGQSPPVAELLAWVTARIPAAMQFPELCVVAVGMNGDLYGEAEALELPRQMVQGLTIRDRQVGRVTIAYREDHDFLDEESALLGDIARRLSGYVENQRLLQDTRSRAERERTVRTISDRMRRGGDAETIMRTGLEELGRMLGTEKIIVRLGSQEQLARQSEPPATED